MVPTCNYVGLFPKPSRRFLTLDSIYIVLSDLQNGAWYENLFFIKIGLGLFVNICGYPAALALGNPPVHGELGMAMYLKLGLGQNKGPRHHQE